MTQSIIDTPLDSDYIVKHLFPQIQKQTDVAFLSTETRESIGKYIKNQTDTVAQSLWTEILIDAICLLKINDQREKLYKDTKDVYDKEHTIPEFSKIRKISTYGIDELKEYFSSFIEFEAVLYGTGEYYRDHLHHVIQVWGLGFGLLWGPPVPIELTLSEGYKISPKNFHFEIEENSYQQISKSELWAMWSIVSLCHDLGYPIEKASKINQKVKKIINHFGCLNFNELNFNFDILNTFIVEKYLNVISSKTVRDKEDVTKSCTCKEPTGKDLCSEKCMSGNNNNSTMIQHKYYDKFSKSLEDYQHGAFSGLLLFKKLTYFLETDFAPNKERLSCEDLRQFYIRKEILRAISGHTCPKIYHINLNTISFLLIFCDELQEWGRPRFKELKAKIIDDEQTINILKFETNEVTETSNASAVGKIPNMDDDTQQADNKKLRTEAIVEVKYPLEIKGAELNTFEKNIVRPKFKNFLCLLRSAKDDKKRNFSFIWNIKTNNIVYSFQFDTNKSAYDMIRTFSQKEKEPEVVFDLYPNEST